MGRGPNKGGFWVFGNNAGQLWGIVPETPVFLPQFVESVRIWGMPQKDGQGARQTETGAARFGDMLSVRRGVARPVMRDR